MLCIVPEHITDLIGFIVLIYLYISEKSAIKKAAASAGGQGASAE